MINAIHHSLFGLLLVNMILFHSQVFGQILFSDDFESGDLSNTSNGFSWEATQNPSVVDFQGSKVARFLFRGSPPGQDAWSELRFTLGAYYRDVWLQYDIFVPNGYFQRVPGGDKSFVHLWTDDYGASNGIGAGFTSWADDSGGGTLSFNQYYPQNPHVYDELRNRPRAFEPADNGRWVTITLNVRAGTGSSDGHAKVWKDGNLTYELSAANHPSWYDMTTFLYQAGMNNRFNNGYVLGWSNSGFDSDTYVYIDNFKFSDTPFINLDPPNPPVLY